jgi:hypothetical protein
MAMYKNCINSLSPFLPAPSAILLGIETTALLIWLDNPYFSSDGKIFVYA